MNKRRRRTYPGLSPEIGTDQLRVFARLADGLSLGEARAEAAAVGARKAMDSPQTHGRQRPAILPYTHAFIGFRDLKWSC